MKIDMDRDYWTEYYAVKKQIENGGARDNKDLYRKHDKLLALAKAKGRIIRNWTGTLTETVNI